jgi:hypothetical protein
MLLSNNAYNEFKKGLCVCFSKDKETAVVTTKEEAQKHKKNINEYVNECCKLNNLCVKAVFGVESGALSTAYDSFADAYPQLLMMHRRFYIIINGQEQLLENKPDDPYYRDQFGTNPLIDCIKYGINTKKDSHLLMTDGDLALVLDGGDPRFVYTRDDLFNALKKIYA